MRAMTMGAQGAEAQPQDGEIEWLGEKPWEAAADPDAYPGNDHEEAPRARHRRPPVRRRC